LTYINHLPEWDCRVLCFRSTIAPMSNVIPITAARDAINRRTPPLNADCARQALRLLLDSLMTDENCKRFRAFPEGYCRDFGLSLEQIHAITDLDIVRLLKLGGTTSELERLTSFYGLDLKELCADQSGKSLEEVQQQLACE